MDRASAFEAEGCRFEPCRVRQRRRRLFFALVPALSLCATPSDAQEPARVIDGDTIEIGKTRVRLHGIDAPEGAQTCLDAQRRSWDCGAVAKKGLDRLIAGRPVTCQSRGTDDYGRTLGVCTVAEIEINATMIREGMAWAFVWREGLGTDHVTVFFHTSEHDRGDPQRSISTVVTLPEATNDTMVLVKAATWGVRKVWKGGYRYSKAGVITVDLVPLEASEKGVDRQLRPRAWCGACGRT